MHIAEVDGSLALGLHSGVPADGNFADGAAFNGVQIRKVQQVLGDLDGGLTVPARTNARRHSH